MCRRITCKSCGKPSFAGCGAHVEQVLADVPKAERCRCSERAPKRDRSDAASAERPSFWKRLLG
jgi:hypothetical protein